MHSTRQQNPIKTLRKLCGLTQVELAEILDCARLTVNSLESGKLKLSHKMAEKFALHTGVSKAWLLANNARSKPVCQRDPTAAFSRQAFERVRAEIERERTSPGELMAVSSYVEQYCAELRDCASTAVQTGDTTYFYYKLRLSLRSFVDQHDRVPVQNAELMSRMTQVLQGAAAPLAQQFGLAVRLQRVRQKPIHDLRRTGGLNRRARFHRGHQPPDGLDRDLSGR
jgi:DNA-binding XRE family transcriptional regulator